MKNVSLFPAALFATEQTNSSAPESLLPLSQVDWDDILIYVNTALKLPTDQKQLADFFGDAAEGGVAKNDLSPFDDLLTTLKNVQEQSQKWEPTYHKVIQTATSISHHSLDTVTTFTSLNQWLNQWLTEKNAVQKAKYAKQINGAVDSLIADAKTYETQAKDAYDSVRNFAEQLKQVEGDLQETRKKYIEKYGEASETTKYLLRSIDEARKELAKWIRRHKAYSGSAGVSPIVAIFTFTGVIGLAAGAALAGLAIDAKVKREEKNREINSYLKQLDANQKLLFQIEVSNTLVTDLLFKLVPAEKVMEKMQTMWSEICDDFTVLKDILNQDVQQAEMFLKKIGVKEAAEQWKLLGKEAERFVVNAYVLKQQDHTA